MLNKRLKYFFLIKNYATVKPSSQKTRGEERERGLVMARGREGGGN